MSKEITIFESRQVWNHCQNNSAILDSTNNWWLIAKKEIDTSGLFHSLGEKAVQVKQEGEHLILFLE